MSQAEFGLVTSGGTLLLESSEVEIKVLVFHSEVKISQTYSNDLEFPVEASFVFPLEAGSAVTRFEVKIDDKLLLGQCMETSRAVEHYNNSIASGQGAYMMEMQREDVFKVYLGNLSPKTQVQLNFSYLSVLQSVGKNSFRFILPAVVSARYTPAGGSRVESELSAPVMLKLKGSLDLPTDIISIEPENSEDLKVEIKGNKASIAFEGELKRDLMFTITTKDKNKNKEEIEIWTEIWEQQKGDDKGSNTLCVMCQLCPDFSEFEDKKDQDLDIEVIFLVDRSGSMMGPSIDQAASSLQLFLRSLPLGSKFNIIGFGSNYDRLFSESQIYSNQSLAKATDYAQGLQANMGGTEILSPLSFIFKQSPASSKRAIIILTDGRVSNEAEVISTITKNANSNTRVYSLGIGSGVSTFLVHGMARAGGGRAEFAQSTERMEPKVMRLVNCALGVRVTDITVDWNGLPISLQTPAPNTFFHHQKSTLFGVIDIDSLPKPLTSSHVKVTVSAMVNDKQYKKTLETTLTDCKGGRILHVLALQELIKNLATSGSRMKAIELSTRYGVLSQYTSYIAVEYRETPSASTMIPVKVKAIIKRELRDQTCLTVATSCAPTRMRESLECKSSVLSSESNSSPNGIFQSMVESVYSLFSGFSFNSSTPAPTPAPAPAPSCPASKSGLRSKYDELILKQQAEGSWDLSNQFANDVLNTTPQNIKLQLVSSAKAHLEKEGKSDMTDLLTSENTVIKLENVFATMIAIHYLNSSFSSFEDEWRLVSHKAEKWLFGILSTLFKGDLAQSLKDHWTDSIQQLFKAKLITTVNDNSY